MWFFRKSNESARPRNSGAAPALRARVRLRLFAQPNAESRLARVEFSSSPSLDAAVLAAALRVGSLPIRHMTYPHSSADRAATEIESR